MRMDAMREPDEILDFINECDQKVNQLKTELNACYEEIEVKITPLVKEFEELKQKKKRIAIKLVFPCMCALSFALAVGAFVLVYILKILFSVLSLLAATGILIWAFSIKPKYDNEYIERVTLIEEKMNKISEKIESIHMSNAHIPQMENEIERLEQELAIARREYEVAKIVAEDKKALEVIGTNNLVVYCSYAVINTNKCFPFVDGVEKNKMNQQFALHRLCEGEHVFAMKVTTPQKTIEIENINFTLNDTSIYVHINHDMDTLEYETKIFDNFEEFADNFRDQKWVRDQIVKLAK